MRVLILEDEPIIAIDLEDIVTSSSKDVHCVLATTVEAGRRCIEAGIDFALLDIGIGHDRNTSYGLAALLLAEKTPFCFVSSEFGPIPSAFRRVPFVAKPFRPAQIVDAIAMAA